MEGLQFVGPEQDILRDIRKGVKHPEEEPIARAAQELRKSSARSVRSAEWSERDGLCTTAVTSTSLTRSNSVPV